MAASLTRQVRLGFSLGWRIWTPNEVGFYAKTLAHSYFILMVLTSKFLKQKIWIVNYTIIMGIKKYFIFVEFLKFGLRTKEERSYWKKIIYITLVIRHRKYNASSAKSIRKKYYDTRSKIKRYEQMLLKSNKGIDVRQGFLDDQYSFSSEKYTQVLFKKKNIKFFKKFNEIIKNFKICNFNKISINKKENTKIINENLPEFWKKITLFNNILKKKGYAKLGKEKVIKNNGIKKKVVKRRLTNLNRFLNIFLTSELSEEGLKLKKILFKKYKKILLKKETKENQKDNKLSNNSYNKLFFKIRKDLKAYRTPISEDKKKLFFNLKFENYYIKKKINCKTSINNFFKLKYSNVVTSVVKNKKSEQICSDFYIKKKINKSKIIKQLPNSISKKKEEILDRILITTGLFLNSEIFEKSKKYSVIGGPRKRLSRNLRRAYKSTSVKKIINLIWFWEKVSRLVSFFIISLKRQNIL